MADEQAPPRVQTLQKAYLLTNSPARPCWAMSATRMSCWCGPGPKSSRSTRNAAIITGRSRRDSSSGDEHPLPLASCLLRSAHRGGHARAGADAAFGLAGRARRRPHLRPAQARAAEAAGKGPIEAPDRIVIVGGGAAGFAAAEMLRRRELSRQHRHAEQRRAPRRSIGRTCQRIIWPAARRKTGCRCVRTIFTRTPKSICGSTAKSPRSTPKRARSPLADGGTFPTTACCWRPAPSRCGCRFRAPISRMSIRLRSLADCRAIIDSAKGARRAIVIGASFIGLEAAAALRAREIEVHVVAPEPRPMERVLGPGMGDFVRALHEEHGVIFHLGDTVTAIDGKRATLRAAACWRPIWSWSASGCGRGWRWPNRPASSSIAASS